MLSCNIYSFYSIFIFSILNPILKDELFNTKKFQYENKNRKDIFNIIIEFCKLIIQTYNNEKLNFFNIYNSEQYNIKYNFLLLKKEEIEVYNSIQICYRPFYDNKLFIIEYNVKHNCTGECKYKSEILETKHTPHL